MTIEKIYNPKAHGSDKKEKNTFKENNLKIYKIELVFRSNIIEFPTKNAEGYFHAQAVGATMSLGRTWFFYESCDQIWKFGYLDKRIK